MKITAQLRLNEKNMDKRTEVASGWVELEDCIKFPVTVRKCIDDKAQEGEMFVSYPQYKTEKGYEYVMYPDDPQVKKEIEDYVLISVKQALLKSMKQVPVTSTHVTLVEPKPGPFKKLCGIASVKLAGITINGITIKEGEDRLLIEMPQRKTSNGWKDAVYGTNVFMQYDIKEAVLEGYKKELELKRQRKVNDGPRHQTAAALKM